MLSNSVPIVDTIIGNGQLARMPDWIAAPYVRKIRKLQSNRSVVLENQYVGFPELLSFSIYGDIRYWRILLMYNGITDWYNGMVVGMTVKIPDLTDVEALYSMESASRLGKTVTL